MARQNVKQEFKKLQQSLSRIVKDMDKLAGRLEHGSSVEASGNGNGKARGRSSGKILSVVEDVIKRSRKGIAIFQIKEKTGLDDRQLSNALYKLTKKGAVEAKSRGVYVATGR